MLPDHALMRQNLVVSLLLSLSPPTLAMSIFSPSDGVICDKASNFCADRHGISIALTVKYLGSQAQERLLKVLGESTDGNLWEYTLSNGVHCDSHEKQCYSDRYYPRTKAKQESKFTNKIFGISQ
ncbi:YcgJ family protein [Yersinia sp. 22-579]|uniref:YcgJ family protein n=1 Tax=Yersinia sp. 22-579 TaxID=3057580 RepID=UPI00345E14ED